jgi:Glycerophosphoryl diester phosphodiesterase
VEGYRGLLYAKPPGRVVDAKKLGCQIALPRYTLATERAIALAHRLGLYVVAWTVNDPATAAELWRRGVDGIATDDVENIRNTKPR